MKAIAEVTAAETHAGAPLIELRERLLCPHGTFIQQRMLEGNAPQ